MEKLPSRLPRRETGANRHPCVIGYVGSGGIAVDIKIRLDIVAGGIGCRSAGKSDGTDFEKSAAGERPDNLHKEKFILCCGFNWHVRLPLFMVKGEAGYEARSSFCFLWSGSVLLATSPMIASITSLRLSVLIAPPFLPVISKRSVAGHSSRLREASQCF